MSETALVRREDANPEFQENRGIVLRSVDEAMRFADIAVRARLVPQGLQTAEAAFVAIASGMELGLSPMQALRSTYVIGNKPTIYGDMPLALCRRSRKFDESQFEETYNETKQEASCTVCRIGGKPLTRTFSMAEAQAAGLVGRNQNYKLYPKRMLGMRARAFALRDAFTDVLMGMAIREEIEDVIDVEAEPVTPAASGGLGASLRAQADKAPVTLPAEASATVTVDASDVEQKKALLGQISHICVSISGGNFGSTDPVIAKYRPVDMTQTVANLQACLAELLAMLPENHKDRQPPEQPKRGRGRPAGSRNKPAEAPQEAQPPAGDPFAPGSVIEFPPPAIPPEIAAYVAKMSTEAQADFVKRHGASGKKFEELPAETLGAMATEAREESDPAAKTTIINSVGALRKQIQAKGGDDKPIFAKHGFPGRSPQECACYELRALERDMSEALAKLMAAAPQEQPPAGDWFGGQ